jgi:hypothetical protein
MRPLLTATAAMTATIGLAWPSGAVEPAGATAPPLVQPLARLGLLGCQVPVPDLPPKDLSKLPEIDCR